MTTPRGFTLFEVLIALAVFGLLMLGLSQGTRLGLTGLAAATRSSDAQEDFAAADRLLRRLVGTIDPGTGLRGPPVFEGAPHRALFIAALPHAAAAVPALRAHVLLLVERRRLLLRWYPYYETALQPPRPQDALLAPDVERLDVSYWQTGGVWVDHWNPADRLPDLVRLHIVLPAGDGRHWPDIVAPTHVGGPA